MGVNNINNGSPVVWSSLNSPRKEKMVDFTNSAKPKNYDKMELNLPVSEAIRTRKEFVTDERMAEGCAFCYTYMERTLTFEDGKGGYSTLTTGSRDGYFIINMDKTEQTFGKSRVNMNDIDHAVEETLEYKARSSEQAAISGGLSGLITESGRTVGGSVGFAAQSKAYKYSSVSETKGTVAFKNGDAGNYRETAASTREIYNKCAVFLAEAFGKKSSDLVLSDSTFNTLFGKLSGDKNTFSANAAQKHENLDMQLHKLREFMKKNLAAVREVAPDCGSLQVFEDTCLKLGAYKYPDITSLVEKMFAAKG